MKKKKKGAKPAAKPNTNNLLRILTPEQRAKMGSNVALGKELRTGKELERVPVVRKYTIRYDLADDKPHRLFGERCFRSAIERFEKAWYAYRLSVRAEQGGHGGGDTESGLPLRSLYIQLTAHLDECTVDLLQYLASPFPEMRPYPGYGDCKNCTARHDREHINQVLIPLAIQKHQLLNALELLEIALETIEQRYRQRKAEPKDDVQERKRAEKLANKGNIKKMLREETDALS